MIRDFNYLKPKDLDEALMFLSEYDDLKIICGGQSLLIVMRQGLVSPEYLMDIKHLRELSYISYDEEKGLKIGATTTHREIEKSPIIYQHYPVLVEMERKLASIQTRNWGTIGGNLCHADPAGDPAPVLISLKATCTLRSRNSERNLPLEDLFVDYFETQMEDDEMMTEIQVPPPPERFGSAYEKFTIIECEMGIVGVAASVTLDDKDRIEDARVVLGAAGPTPIRVKEAEELLSGEHLTDALLEKVGDVAKESSDPISDVHASEEYRRHLVKVLTKRMLKKAWERARGK